jgi:aspartyl-tRNA(Asn)/glutamyl-tRNA(Gln) amidotransferase subunit A
LSTFEYYTNHDSKYEEYFEKAQQMRRLISNDFEEIFNQGYDFILTPTTPTSAISLEQFYKLSPVEKYVNDIFTVPASLAGLPALSVPALRNHNQAPIGLQVIAPNEYKCLTAGEMLEQTH